MMKSGAVGGRKYGDADMDPAPCPTDDKDRSAVGNADDTNAAPCLADGTANLSDADDDTVDGAADDTEIDEESVD